MNYKFDNIPRTRMDNLFRTTLNRVDIIHLNIIYFEMNTWIVKLFAVLNVTYYNPVYVRLNPIPIPPVFP